MRKIETSNTIKQKQSTSKKKTPNFFTEILKLLFLKMSEYKETLLFVTISMTAIIIAYVVIDNIILFALAVAMIVNTMRALTGH